MRMAFLWLALAVFLGIIEACTVQLVSIWIAGGAVAATVIAACGFGMGAQIGIFLAVSAILLIATRPFVKKFTNAAKEKTNSDRIIGQKVVITEKVDNIASTGKTVINGVEWTARSNDGRELEEGSIAVVKKIEGVKLIVG